MTTPLTSGYCSLKAATCECPLKAKFPIFVPPEGDMDGGGVVIMGEAGGVTEGEQGRPFVGRTGKELRGALSQIDVPIDAIYNMVPRALRQYTPSKREVSACWDCHVGQWLTSLHPQLIVAVGGVAAGFLAGVGVEKFHSSAYPCIQPGLDGIPVFVTFHPSAMVRNRPKYQALFEGDYTALEAYYHDRQHLDHAEYSIHDISELHSLLQPEAKATLDFETTSLDTTTARIVGVAVRTNNDTRYYNGEPNSDDLEALLSRRSTWYNGVGYDLRLFPGELKYAEVDDVLIKARLLQKPYGSLRDLAAYEYGIQHENMKLLAARNTVGDVMVLTGVGWVPLSELAGKAMEDVELTDTLDIQYSSELESANMSHIYLLERAVAPLVRRTEDYGMRIDTEAAATQLTKVTVELSAQEAVFRDGAPWRQLQRVVTTTWAHLFGPLITKWPGHGKPRMVQQWSEPVNPRSPQQLSEMFAALGIVLTKTTDGGQLSVDGEVLEGIDHPIADLLRAYRKAEKRQQFVSALVAAGQWLHFRLKPLGAVSGRFSSGSGEETDQ